MKLLDDLRTLWIHDGFRKLFTVRLVSQCGDGMFQVGLATLFFFSPQNMATAGGVAAAFAVLLLPFTVVGPFAGPLLDRWRRRQVLFVGNAVRVVITVVLAALLATGIGPAVYALALVNLGINRFLLSALSAGLPRVVPAPQLVMANAITPSLGAVSAVVGAGLGFLLGRTTPERFRDSAALAAAAILFAGASALALRMAPNLLGPDRPPSSSVRADLMATTTDLAAGARYLVRRGTPGLALTAMAGHRFLYGVNFIALILLSRNLLADPANPDAGLATFATLTLISFAGNGVGILATPVAHERMRSSTWIVVCLVLGAAAQIVISLAPRWAAVAVGAWLMGFAVQGAKIAVDTIVQRDTADAFRGRAFALYDMAYNAAFVAAAALAAVALPDDGWSRPVFAALTAAYLVLAAGYRRRTRLLNDTPLPAN